MAILKLKTARKWSLEQTAKTFLVTAATIASWLKRVDEKGVEALVQLPKPPVNKFPEFTGRIVRQLKTLCPLMGKVKIAETLARAACIWRDHRRPNDQGRRRFRGTHTGP